VVLHYLIPHSVSGHTFIYLLSRMASSIQSTASDLLSSMKLMGKPKDMTSVVLLMAAVVCIIVPLDISQLVFAIAGALGFSAIQMMHSKSRSASSSKKKVHLANPKMVDTPDVNLVKKTQMSQKVNTTRKVPAQQHSRLPTQPDVRKPSSMPISAPTFQSTEW